MATRRFLVQIYSCLNAIVLVEGINRVLNYVLKIGIASVLNVLFLPFLDIPIRYELKKIQVWINIFILKPIAVLKCQRFKVRERMDFSEKLWAKIYKVN